MIVRAAHEDSDGKLVSCWPEMWPPSRVVKEENPEYEDLLLRLIHLQSYICLHM